MPRRDKGAQAKARGAAETARPYVQRLIEDDDLRSDLREAYEAARDAYERAVDGKSAKSVLEDRKLQTDLKTAAESLRSASEALREPEKKSDGGSGFGKLLFVAMIGAILALALSEDLRKAVLDKLFGAEEEFEYTSTTTAGAPTPSASG